MNKYFWNFNEHEEVWQNSCPTIEDCIDEAKWEKEDREIAEKHVFIGEVESYKPKIDAEDVIENVIEAAYQECGECSEGWIDSLTKEPIKDLDNMLNQTFLDWLEQNKLLPGFGNFIKVSKYNLETGKEEE